MLSKPSKYCTFDSHYINSLLFTVDPEKINSYLSDEDKELPSSLMTCSKCGISLHSDFVNEDSLKCICGEKKFKGDELQQIKKQSIQDFFWSQSTSEKNKKKQVLLIICLDNSGSMISNYKAPENHVITEYIEERNAKNKSKAEFGEEFSKDFNAKNPYISRKELILLYLKKQLKEMINKNTNIEYLVYAILFSNTVTLFGDGITGKPRKLSQSEFDQIKNDPKECMKFGRKEGQMVFSTKTKPDIDLLFEKLDAETQKGATSLAPAIAIGLGFLKSMDREPDTCQFMIFTDGLANNGFGNIEEAKLLKTEEICMKEYENLGNLGFDWEVVFHLFAFEEDAGIRYLAQMTEKTRFGQLSKLKVETNQQRDQIYDEEKFTTAMKTAFKMPKELNFTNVELKVFYDKRIKVNFCKSNKENTERKDVGSKAKVLIKNIGPIYTNVEKNGLMYEVPKEIKAGEKLIFQFQLLFSNMKDKKQYTIVFNEKIEVKKEDNITSKIDFQTLSLIMLLDQLQTDSQKMQDFLDFMKNRGDEESFQILKKYLEKFEVALIQVEKNEKKFKKQLALSQQKKEQEKKKLSLKGKDKKKPSKLEEEEHKIDSDEVDSDEDTITLTTLEIRKKLKEEENKIFQNKK